LPGGERTARQPWRTALALCWESGIDWAEGADLADLLLRQAFERELNAPTTSAVGRLFDAAAALLGICRQATYEGEAPMRLEALSGGIPVAPVPLPLARDAAGVWRSDWEPLLGLLLNAQCPLALRAATFHASLAQALCAQALQLRNDCGVTRVGLTGGVFQNQVLSEQASARLRAAGFEVLMPRQLPVNDAAISYGQLVEAAASSTG
jgi:hydrogenase maturation protein HypF